MWLTSTTVSYFYSCINRATVRHSDVCNQFNPLNSYIVMLEVVVTGWHVYRLRSELYFLWLQYLPTVFILFFFCTQVWTASVMTGAETEDDIPLGERKTVTDFCYLLDKSKQLFNGLRSVWLTFWPLTSHTLKTTDRWRDQHGLVGCDEEPHRFDLIF